MTKQERLIVSGYTGVMMCEVRDLLADVSKRAGRPVHVHELGGDQGLALARELYGEDFQALCESRPPSDGAQSVGGVDSTLTPGGEA